jgi:hypothetical protein
VVAFAAAASVAAGVVVAVAFAAAVVFEAAVVFAAAVALAAVVALAEAVVLAATVLLAAGSVALAAGVATGVVLVYLRATGPTFPLTSVPSLAFGNCSCIGISSAGSTVSDPSLFFMTPFLHEFSLVMLA